MEGGSRTPLGAMMFAAGCGIAKLMMSAMVDAAILVVDAGTTQHVVVQRVTGCGVAGPVSVRQGRPAAVGVTRNFVVMPGTASIFIRQAGTAFENPMIDRDPIPRWTFGAAMSNQRRSRRCSA